MDLKNLGRRRKENQPKGEPGKKKRILSLDGGGVRGIISAVILQRLESHLQNLVQTKDVRIAEYFDAIAGTSTGGLLACLLVVPDPVTKRPKYTAQDAVKFYLEKSAIIFSGNGSERGPKYDSAPLEKLLKDTCGDLKLSETVKPVIVPSYDMYSENPVLFSKTQVKSKQIPDCFIRDVCRATSAAPTYFAPYYFSVTTNDGPREFNMVDGAVFANNPAFVAISELLRDSDRPEPLKYEDLLVLSLGTGNSFVSYSAKDAANWDVLKWIAGENDNCPILDIMSMASEDMVDYIISNTFHEQQSQANYLRVQTNDIKGEQRRMDNSSPENLKALVDIATSLLDKQPMIRDNTGKFVPNPRWPTYDAALEEFAQWLKEEDEKEAPLMK